MDRVGIKKTVIKILTKTSVPGKGSCAFKKKNIKFWYEPEDDEPFVMVNVADGSNTWAVTVEIAATPEESRVLCMFERTSPIKDQPKDQDSA